MVIVGQYKVVMLSRVQRQVSNHDEKLSYYHLYVRWSVRSGSSSGTLMSLSKAFNIRSFSFEKPTSFSIEATPDRISFVALGDLNDT